MWQLPSFSKSTLPAGTGGGCAYMDVCLPCRCLCIHGPKSPLPLRLLLAAPKRRHGSSTMQFEEQRARSG